MRNTTGRLPKLPLTLDVNELSKYFSKEQRQDVLDLHTLCLNTIPGRIRGPRVRKVDPGHIPRPVNCFMVYRKDKQELIRKFCPTANHRNISKIIANWWAREDSNVKKHYVAQADIAKAEHSRKYPDYTFRPKSKKEKKVIEKKAQASKAGELRIPDYGDTLWCKQGSSFAPQTVNYAPPLSHDIGQFQADGSMPIFAQLPVTSTGMHYVSSIPPNGYLNYLDTAQVQQTGFVMRNAYFGTPVISDNNEPLQQPTQSISSYYGGDNNRFIESILLNMAVSPAHGYDSCPQDDREVYPPTTHFFGATTNEVAQSFNHCIDSLSPNAQLTAPNATATPFQTAAVSTADFTPALDSYPTPAVPQSDLLTIQTTPEMPQHHTPAWLDSLPTTASQTASPPEEVEFKLEYPLPSNGSHSASSYEYFTDLYQSLQAHR